MTYFLYFGIYYKQVWIRFHLSSNRWDSVDFYDFTESSHGITWKYKKTSSHRHHRVHIRLKIVNKTVIITILLQNLTHLSTRSSQKFITPSILYKLHHLTYGILYRLLTIVKSSITIGLHRHHYTYESCLHCDDFVCILYNLFTFVCVM